MIVWEQTGYSVVCACVVVLRVAPEDRMLANEVALEDATKSSRALRSILITAIIGFAMGLSYRLKLHPGVMIGLSLLEIVSVVPMYTHQVWELSALSCFWMGLKVEAITSLSMHATR
jgi:hypothetical protein